MVFLNPVCFDVCGWELYLVVCSLSSDGHDLSTSSVRILLNDMPFCWPEIFSMVTPSFNEELHNFYSSPDIIRQVKSRRMRWAGHVARMGERRKVYRVLVGKPEGKNHLEDQGVGGKMGSEWILRRLTWGGGCGLDSTGSGQGPVAGCCECGDEPSGSCTTELVTPSFAVCFFSKLLF
jgi:hypothetical protein